MARFVSASSQVWQPGTYTFGPYNVPQNIDSITVYVLPNAVEWPAAMHDAIAGAADAGAQQVTLTGLPSKQPIYKWMRLIVGGVIGPVQQLVVWADTEASPQGVATVSLMQPLNSPTFAGDTARLSKTVIIFSAEQSLDNGATWFNWGGAVYATGPFGRAGADSMFWAVASSGERNRARVVMQVIGEPITLGLDADFTKKLPGGGN